MHQSLSESPLDLFANQVQPLFIRESSLFELHSNSLLRLFRGIQLESITVRAKRPKLQMQEVDPERYSPCDYS